MVEAAPARIVGKRYQLLQTIGSGNMGTVYQASDLLTGQMVALKQVKVAVEQLEYGSRSSTGDASVTLAQEFRILASLRHPNIISVLDYGFDATVGEYTGRIIRHPYITMELLANAQDFLEIAEKQPAETKLALLTQVLQALHYLHRRNVLHRDLKPRNILVVEDQAKVLDFGLSIVGEQIPGGEIAGTPSYMAPELWVGSPASKQSDLYALGVIAYRMFAGRHPFDTSSLKTLFAELNTRNPDLSLLNTGETIQNVIGRMLAKAPEDRYADASEIINALRGLTGQPLRVETAAMRESFLQAATFVGREAEMAQLWDMLNDALAGTGRACLIAGESGVGKSRLLEELRVRALVEGVLVLRGQAVNESSPPYDIWRTLARWLTLLTELDEREAGILKTIVPDIAHLLGRAVPDPPEVTSQAAQLRLMIVIEKLFRSQSSVNGVPQPIVLILEDLQWADGDSLTMLNRLSQLAASLPLLIVGSFRDDDSPNLPRLLPAMEVITLKRLTPRHTAALAEAMLGAAGRNPELIQLLQNETEGNTFFLVETVRALAEEVGRLEDIGSEPLPMHLLTGGIKGIIQRRLNRVPDEARRLLHIAAVAGRQLDLSVLREVLKGEGQAQSLELWLTDCADAAVLEMYEGSWRFVHNKLRDGVIVDMALTDFQDLNQRVAEAIETVYQYSTKPTAETLMYRWRMVGDFAKEEHYAALAGEQALRSGAHLAAAEFLLRALNLQDYVESSRRKQAQLKQQLGDAYMELGKREEAHRLFLESLQICRDINYRWGTASNLNRLGAAAVAKGDNGGGARLLYDALKTAMEARAQTVALASIVAMAHVLSNNGSKITALEYATLAMHHPSCDGQTYYLAERLAEQIRLELPPAIFEESIERGKHMELKEAASRILAGG
jgi:tetratricopeptide (TPR) repeat protein